MSLPIKSPKKKVLADSKEKRAKRLEPLVAPPRFAIKSLRKPTPLEQMHLAHPFLPASTSPNIIGRFVPPVLPERPKQIVEEGFAVPPDLIVHDAETGESLSLTRSSWTASEGRVDLNRDTILKMGTGKLTIAYKKQLSIMAQQGQQDNNEDNSVGKQHRNQILTDYMKNGPLNKRQHRFWNARADDVIMPADLSVESLREEGVDYYEKSQEEQENGLNGDRLDKCTVEGSDNDDDIENRSIHSRGSATSSITDAHHAEQQARVVTIPHDLDPYNDARWQALEDQYFEEVFGLIQVMERNKKLTREPRLRADPNAVKRACRDLAKLKAKGYRQIVQAIEDERVKDLSRKALEAECKNDKSRLKLQAKHAEEQEKSRVYLRSLQHDNEVIFLMRMSDEGLLW